MIRINRPDFPHSPNSEQRISSATEKLSEFFEPTTWFRVQKTPPFDETIYPIYHDALLKVFNKKCAYCETLISRDVAKADLFRPRFGAIDPGSGKVFEGYWWIAYEWENLYPVCAECNFNKGFKFPVEGDRGPIHGTVAMLRSKENALLLDPCFDDPSRHLIFSDNGLVASRTEKGKTTIRLLNLNRPDLQNRRRYRIARFRETVTDLIKKDGAYHEWIVQMLRDREEFAAALRQSFQRILAETPTARRKSKMYELLNEQVPKASRTTVARLLKKWHQDHRVSLSSDLGRTFLRQKTPVIRRIEIKNFGNIEDMTLEPGDIRPEGKPWLVMMGENGMGKSSILKAVALTLMNDKHRRTLGLSGRTLVRRGAKDGSVKVFVDGYPLPFSIHFTSSSSKIESSGGVLHSLLFCYGSTRLLPVRYGPQPDRRELSDEFSRVGNLFRPQWPLTNVRKWLLRDLDDEQFAFTAKAIKQLLGREEDDSILTRRPAKNPQRIRLEDPKTKTRDELHVLSDGYRSVIALVADILEIALPHFTKVDAIEGKVLIDEIELHLHPKWKIQIIELLRSVFPRMQFLITTHDHLCLHGTLPKEIHIISKNHQTHRIEARQVDLPPGATSDRILTGEWFDLSSTLDPDTQNMLERHRQLLRAFSRTGGLPADQLSIKKNLEAELRRRLGTFADTSIDRMALSVASEVIRGDLRDLTFEQRTDMRDEIRARLTALVTPTKQP